MMLVGVVGKANVGKSTFFKAATLAEVEIANYPFATIRPNSGVGYVKIDCADKFFNTQCNPREGFCIEHKRFVPVQLIDVAGLVPGAHEGKGMGNQFLDDLRQADVLIHVVDIAGTTNEKGEPIETLSYDPAKDIRFLEEELDFWILRLIKKGWDKFARTTQQTHGELNKAITSHLSGLNVKEELVKEIIGGFGLADKSLVEWGEEDLVRIASEIRRKTKPMIIACNKIDIPGADENFRRMQQEFPDRMLVRCSADSELALREAAKHGLISYIPGEKKFGMKESANLSEKQKAALNFIKTNVLDKYGSTGVQDVLDKAVFDVLKYIPIFPGGVNKLADQKGNIMPDCFLLPGNSTALDFAYRLHTDFGNKFIRAIDVKTKLTVGKDHRLKPGDVIEIVADK
ncbi:redox-regulated ATPase YchF [Candidatus Woesearchaeota archaeon]|nr:redox-regulated ATPase YchF [Candidatus Woesearchaeota archaeon]